MASKTVLSACVMLAAALATWAYLEQENETPGVPGRAPIGPAVSTGDTSTASKLTDATARVVLATKSVDPESVPVPEDDPDGVIGKAQPPVPPWLKQAAYSCGLSDDDVRLIADSPTLSAEIQDVWNIYSKDVSELVSKRSKLSGKLSRERQDQGRYELFKPGQRLPDADNRIGEFITFGFEDNPDGGRDIVRVVRIYRGESPEFDLVRDQEAAATTAHRETLRGLVDAHRAEFDLTPSRSTKR